MKKLMLDVETAPHKAYVWGLFNQNVGLNQIAEPGYTMCYAAKWFGEKKIFFDSMQKNGALPMLEGIHSLLEKADAVIHFNGTKFDIPVLKAEFLEFGFDPPKPFKEIDLYRTVRGQFRFASNKLAYVSEKLLGVGKEDTGGMELWTACMAGDKKAWKKMEKYNKQDVKLLEPLYAALRPWILTHPNEGLYLDRDVLTCRNCGSEHLQKRGFAYTTVGKYQQYQCMDCGKWSRGGQLLNTIEERRNLTR